MHISTSRQGKLNLGFGNYTCNWGVHIAGLYETAEERDEILFGFLQQGCSEGDFQLYLPSERPAEEFERRFTDRYPFCQHELHDSHYFNISTPREFYYPDGTFSVQQMDKKLNQFYNDTQINGARNIRAASEMNWMKESIPGIEHVMLYESWLNNFIAGKQWISICLYNVRKFTGDVILNVLRTHPYTISGGIITSNPYYLPPDEWLSKNT